jgi:hypothetical protein
MQATASEMLQVRRPDEQIGSSIISDGFNGGVSPGGLPLPMESHAERQMLLISHDRGTTSSTLSLSTGTNSTHDPPSTVDEPRISISSTIYTKSSHAQSLYSQHHNPQSFIPEPMSSRPYSEYRDARSRSHRSFIELSSQSDLAPAFPYSNRVGDFPQANLNTIGLTKSEQHPINTSVNAIPRPLSSSRKPPLPNTPKPIFNRLPGQLSSSKKHPPAPDLHILSNLYTVDRDMLPPTTNYLNPDERADLIKKSRKLTQVFGMTPGPESFTTQHDESHGGFIICSRGQRQRGPTYVSKDVQTSHIQSPAWPPAEGTRYLSANGRRHSTPLTPDEFSFLAQTTDGEISLQIGSNAEDRISYSVSSDHSNVHDSDGESPLAPSFIGLSNGEGLGDDMSSITSKKRRKRRAGLSSPSAPSFFENKTPEELAEAEKRRRRDKLARIHRFLGLRVPTDLVLGQCAPLASLPSTPRERTPLNALAEHEIDNHQDNIRHRRISSAVLTPSLWPDDLERLKEDLDGREKAINVRRAQKMGKVYFKHSGFSQHAQRFLSTGIWCAASTDTLPYSPVAIPFEPNKRHVTHRAIVFRLPEC